MMPPFGCLGVAGGIAARIGGLFMWNLVAITVTFGILWRMFLDYSHALGGENVVSDAEWVIMLTVCAYVAYKISRWWWNISSWW